MILDKDSGSYRNMAYSDRDIMCCYPERVTLLDARSAPAGVEESTLLSDVQRQFVELGQEIHDLVRALVATDSDSSRRSDLVHALKALSPKSRPFREALIPSKDMVRPLLRINFFDYGPVLDDPEEEINRIRGTIHQGVLYRSRLLEGPSAIMDREAFGQAFTCMSSDQLYEQIVLSKKYRPIFSILHAYAVLPGRLLISQFPLSETSMLRWMTGKILEFTLVYPLLGDQGLRDPIDGVTFDEEFRATWMGRTADPPPGEMEHEFVHAVTRDLRIVIYMSRKEWRSRPEQPDEVVGRLDEVILRRGAFQLLIPGFAQGSLADVWASYITH